MPVIRLLSDAIRSVRALRAVVAPVLAALTLGSCSESTSPGDKTLAWEYRSPTGPALTPELISLVGSSDGSRVVIDPVSGREKWRIPDATAGSLTRAGSVVVLDATQSTTVTDIRVFDFETGRQLFVIRSTTGLVTVFGTLGTTVIGAIADSIIVAQDRATGRELWRSRLPTSACLGFCGALSRVSALPDELILRRSTDATSAFVRIRADGVSGVASTATTPFRGSFAPTYAARKASTDPVVVATSRALTAIDVSSGATLWQARIDTVFPRSFLPDPIKYQLSDDGAFFTVTMFDTTRATPLPVRDIVLRTTDGSRVGQREFSRETASDYLDSPCDAAGRVRVLPDLRVEYVDLASGRVTTTSPVAVLQALRTIPTVTGFISAPVTVSAGQIIFYDIASSALRAVRCRG